MADKKQSLYVNFASQAGIAHYAWLNKPDQGSDFSDNKFKVTVAWNKDDPFVATLNAIVQDAAQREFGDTLPNGFNNPIKDGDAGDKEQFSGKVYATFKSTRRPSQVDASNFELPEDVIIMGGDKVRVAAAAKAYNGAQKGVCFYLDMVKLIEKNNGGGNKAANMFGEDEGYSIADAPVSTPVVEEKTGGEFDIDEL